MLEMIITEQAAIFYSIFKSKTGTPDSYLREDVYFDPPISQYSIVLKNEKGFKLSLFLGGM